LIAQDDREQIAALMKDTNFWLEMGVPADRIARRAALFDEHDRGASKLCA
jgi:hypothetical protein